MRYGKPEREEGNVEYKLKISPSDEDRIERLATQLNYRLKEGGGEAFYEIGISDNGEPVGISEEEAKKTFEAMNEIVKRIGATYMIIRKERVGKGYVYELLIRRTLDVPPVQVSVALLGNVDAGKSTLKGVLVSGTLDDGDGLAMSKVVRYLHELKFRRSSSVSIHLLGFDEHGGSVNEELIEYDEAEIYLKSTKVITLVDLAGHEKYLKTTLKGVLGSTPDYVAMVMGANAGPIGSFKEHLGISVTLRIPLFVVVTKLDMTPQEILKNNLRKLYSLLKLPGVNKVPFVVKDMNDVAIAARNMPYGRVAPIFLVSNVTGEGLPLLKKFLNILPPRLDWHEKIKDKFLVYIDEKFNVTGVGLVVSGLVEAGRAKVGDRLLMGPFHDGSFRTVRVKSIHVNRVPVQETEAGQLATFAITNVDYNEVRKGMVLLDMDQRPRAVRTFKAKIRVLHHPTTIKVGYEPVIQFKTVKQPAKLIESTKPFLRSGERALVTFRFIKRPEYVTIGTVFLFREGRTKGLGKVVELVN